MRCFGVTFCVLPHEICDGIAHCPKQEDEKYCQVCPQNCHCKGSTIYCNNVVTSLQNYHPYSPSALILYNSYSIFVELFNHSLTRVNYVCLIDLRYGSFVNLIEQQEEITMHYFSVKFLFLNHQGIYTLPPNFIDGPHILYLNLSHNIIQSVHENAFFLMKNVKTLSLTSNKLNSLETYFYSDLGSLSQLYLNDNPLMNIAGSVFLQNPGLMMIRSDWYMVCCVAIDTNNCQPQNQFVSSCSNLISSTGQIVMIMVQGIIKNHHLTDDDFSCF